VLNAGSQVTPEPWLKNVKALIWAFFPGQEGTQAIDEVLTGTVNPSGKLPFTIAKKWEEYPSFGNFPGVNGEVDYNEGLLVGYRYFDTKNVEPEFPFGSGMSYTTFALSGLKVKATKGDAVEATVTVKNTGSAAGSEVVQLYVHDKKPALFRPEKELKAFAKVSLNAGESKTVSLKLNRSSFEYYDDVKNAWVRSRGGYELLVGTSSRNLSLRASVK
jgi:beta-glucosidase